MCKYWKHQGFKDTFGNQTPQEQRALLSEREEEDDLARSYPSRSKKARKLFSVEKQDLSPAGEPRGGWFVYRRYATGDAAEKALGALQRSMGRYAVSLGGGPRSVFRIGERGISAIRTGNPQYGRDDNQGEGSSPE